MDLKGSKLLQKREIRSRLPYRKSLRFFAGISLATLIIYFATCQTHNSLKSCNLAHLNFDSTEGTPLVPSRGSRGGESHANNLRIRKKYPDLTKDLVLATQSWDNLTWAEDLKAVYNVKRYIVNNPDAEFTVASRTGMEAMVYLTYIIDHYDKLPDTATFHHSHDVSWHSPGQDGGHAAKYLLDIQHHNIVDSIGYRSLHCKENGCRDDEGGMWPSKRRHMEDIFTAEAWLELFPNDPVPDHLQAPQSSQFVVSRKAIQSRSKAEYVGYRDWMYNIDTQPSIMHVDVAALNQTREEFNKRRPGYMFEYLWQYIFLNKAIDCPTKQECSCTLYDACFETEADYERYITMPPLLKKKVSNLEKTRKMVENERNDRLKELARSSGPWKALRQEDLASWEARMEHLVDAEEKHILSFENEMIAMGMNIEE